MPQMKAKRLALRRKAVTMKLWISSKKFNLTIYINKDSLIKCSESFYLEVNNERK